MRLGASRRGTLIAASCGGMLAGVSLVVYALVSTAHAYQPDRAVAFEAAHLPGATSGTRIMTVAASAVSPAPGSDDRVPQPAPEFVSLYGHMPRMGADIGTLVIPRLKLATPILQGTSEAQLRRGVGHIPTTVLPGELDNVVLSGHRETVFRHLGDVRIGDRLITRTSAGTFTYVVTRLRIVDDEDRTVIVPTDDATLTLTTCYPFDTPGYLPSRYIVVAKLAESRTR